MPGLSTLRLLLALACLAGAAAPLLPSAPASARADLPAWFVRHMARSTAQGGRWITDNEDYRSSDGPIEAYGSEWKYGLGQRSLSGRLFGLSAGEEIGTYWEFRSFWHPEEERVVLHQYGADGRVGIGHLELDDEGREVSIQTFYALDGTRSRVRHLAWYESDGSHVTVSYREQDGAWVEDRSYVWELETD